MCVYGRKQGAIIIIIIAHIPDCGQYTKNMWLNQKEQAIRSGEVKKTNWMNGAGKKRERWK